MSQLKYIPDDKLGERYPGAYKLSKCALNLYARYASSLLLTATC